METSVCPHKYTFFFKRLKEYLCSLFPPRLRISVPLALLKLLPGQRAHPAFHVEIVHVAQARRLKAGVGDGRQHLRSAMNARCLVVVLPARNDWLYRAHPARRLVQFVFKRVT